MKSVVHSKNVFHVCCFTKTRNRSIKQTEWCFVSCAIIQGNTGVLLGMFLVSLVVVVALVTVMSGIGVSEHCGVGSGGIYSMISTVLGSRVGGTVGLLYVFGQVSRDLCFASARLQA